MVAPGRNFVVSPLFGPKSSDDKKKVIAVKVMGIFSPEICEFQNQNKDFAAKLVGFQFKWERKKNLHHKSVEIWFHFIIWCHSKMVTPGAGPPFFATPLLYHWYVYKYCATGKYNVIKNQTLFCWRPWFKRLAATVPPPLLFYKPLWSFFTLKSKKKLWKLQLCLTAGIFLGLDIVFLL